MLLPWYPVACAAPDVAGLRLLPEIRPATDRDPDPAVLEVELVAQEAEVEVLDGTTTDLWVWRDPGAEPGMPGPLLDLAGASRLVIHLANALPQSTTIHVHGLRLPADQDGTVHAQLVVYPGETWDYAFDVVDEGLAWLHPHVESHLQLERGLYAPIRASGGDPLPVSADRVIVLDDLRLDADGAFDPLITADDLYAGRTADLLLVNGAPAGTSTVLAGRRERWRLLNAATARTFRLGLPATVIAHEGGTLAAPEGVDEVVLAPGDRVEVLLEVARGERFPVEALPVDRGFGPEPASPELLFEVVGIGGPDPGPIPTRAGRPPLVAPDAPLRELVFTREASTRYAIGGQSWPFDVPLEGALGAVERWRLVNETGADLPFHLHGTFFQPAVDPPRWEDVASVPPETTLEVLVPLDAPGAWMFHSHVLEHAEAGMMGTIVVSPP
jgi:FtsP/CotA-like multicopper oxidase with cupredoxin domain